MPDVTDSGSGVAQGGSLTPDRALHHLDVAVICADADGVVTTWNGRAEALYGWTREEAVGRKLGEVIRRKDGSAVAVLVKASPVHDERGELIGTAHVAIELADPELASALRAPAAHTNHDGRDGRRRGRTLSPREREVLALLARGLTGEQIAERLVLSPETVRTHIRNAREKLGASTRVEAVTMALLGREIQV